MPGYKTHLLGGTLTFAALYAITVKLNVLSTPLCTMSLLGTTLLGALIPDLDINSKIQRFFYFCIIAGFLYFLLTHEWVALITTSLLAIIIGILRHRTILHHPLFLALLPLPIIYYVARQNYPVSPIILPSIFFVAGSWSHLLLDFGLKLNMKKR